MVMRTSACRRHWCAASSAQPVQVGVVILFSEEAGFAVVAALHDMQRDAIEVDAGAAGHGRRLHPPEK